jgi:hypothetical protein
MRLTRLTVKFTASALGLAMGAAVLALPVPARAGDDDVPIDTKILRGILEGIGLKRDGDAINYQERSPLVIPPTHDLPPPQTSDSTVANNPAWPKDPDVARRKAQAAAERNRNVAAEFEREQNPLPPNLLAPGAKDDPKAARRVGAIDTNPSVADTGQYRMSPAELGDRGNLFSKMFESRDDSVGKFTHEPPRVSLTDPPPGYRTPSPNQPYGLGKEASAPKATNYLATHGELSGR